MKNMKVFFFLCLGKHQQLKNTNSFVDENSTENAQALHLLICSVSQTSEPLGDGNAEYVLC